MPATSQQQQKLFGLALSVKRGETPRSEVSDEVLNIVDTMSEKKIKDFAETSHKGLPTKVESLLKSLVRDSARTKVLGEATEPDKVSKYWTGQSPIQKMFSKIGFIGSEWTHSELKNQLKNLSDQSLKMLYDELKSNKGIKSSDPLAYMFRNTSKDYQQKLTKLEMEKRGLLEVNTTKVENVIRNLVRETFREKALGENKFIKPKDEMGVRTVKAIHNNINSIYELVIGKKKNPNEVLSAFSSPLINSIKQAIKHNYKPNSTTKLNKTVHGDVSNEERIKIFKGELNKILQLAEKVAKKPTIIGVKELFMGWRDVWNYKNGAKIGLSGESYNSIVEAIGERVLSESTLQSEDFFEVYKYGKALHKLFGGKFDGKKYDKFMDDIEANTPIAQHERLLNFMGKQAGMNVRKYANKPMYVFEKDLKTQIEKLYKTHNESVNEATPIQTIFRKIGWAGDDWTPQDYAKKIKNLPDTTLKIWYDSAKSNKGIPNTPLAFQQKLTKLEMEKRGLLEIVNEAQEQLDEKLITFSNRKPYGQVVFIAGGAASGKGFAISNFIDSSSFKVRDVDEMKKQLQKLNSLGKLSIKQIVDKFGKNIKPVDLEIIQKIQDDGFDLKTMDLKNPDHVYGLHLLVKAMGIKDQSLANMLSSAKNPEVLPNIMFDITAKEIGDITEVLPQLILAGYTPNNIHLVWILTNYDIALKQNKDRDRVVPYGADGSDNIMLKTHLGAGNTIWGLVTKALPKDMNGRVDVVLNNRENTIPYTEKDEKTLIKVQARGKKQPEIVVKSFLSLPVKKQGGSILPEKLWKDILYKWIKDNAPAELTANM